MKNKYLKVQFFIVLFFFFFPPVLRGPGESEAGFSPQIRLGVVIQLASAVFLFFQNRISSRIEDENERRKERLRVTFRTSYWWALTLGFLMIVYAFIELTCIILDLNQYMVRKPFFDNTPMNWACTAFLLAVSAFYEETLYRQYIPETLMEIIPKKGKATALVSEILSVTLFALAHRYMGFVPVINALISGAILRFSYKKTESIYAGFIAHFTYNALLVVLAALSS